MMYTYSLQRAVRHYSDRAALRMGEELLTFRQLHNRVRMLAAALAREGFQAGDRLGLLLPNSPEYIQLVYACSWLGVIAVPINTRLSAVEIDRVLADASPRGVARHSSLPAPSYRAPWGIVVDEAPLPEWRRSCPDPIYDPEAILALIYTSGTTGQPKGVMVSHANMLADVHHVNYWIPDRDNGAYLHAAPMFHIADFPAMFAAPASGACQTTLARFSPSAFCAAVAKDRITHTVLVPTMLNLLAQFADLANYDMRSLDLLAYGGSPIAPELIRKTRALLPKIKLVQVYGLSETGFLTGLQDHEHTEERLMSCGRPAPDIEVQVVDEFGEMVEAGQRGELVARASNVSGGYWRKPKETAAAFRNGFFRTGDIGYQDANGYVYILDRLKDMIVTGSENVYCGEVEAVIYNHPAVREAAVFGIPDPQWGELVTACVVRKPGMQLTEDGLIQHCRKSLAHYKVPRHVEFPPEDLPKSGTGKVLKRLLRERFWAGAQRDV